VRHEIAVRGVHFLGARDAHAVMVVVRLVRRAGTGFVHDEAPRRIRMHEHSLPIRAFDHAHRQQVGQHGQRFAERAALVMPVREPERFQHGAKLTMAAP
jgi:hypothetical protein